MDINQLLTILTGDSLLKLFVKSFAILFSFLFVIYSIVLLRQTKQMVHTLQVRKSYIFVLISTIQLLASLVLLLLAIFVV